MTFSQPWLLSALLLVPLAALAAVWWRRRRPARALPFPDLDLVATADPGPRLRRHLPAALALLALAGFAVALARPQMWQDQPRERATIVLAVDVSGSMAATDVSPYRLRAAQDAALRFADEVPRRYQVGLVGFSGQANLLVAPTTDRASLRRAIEGLRPFGATAVGEAIETSLEAIRATRTFDGDGTAETLQAARIVVLSDGATTVGIPPALAAQDAARAGVPVYTVALGTPMARLPDGTPVPPDPQGLAQIAEATGGSAYESTDAESVSTVYARLGSFIGTERARVEVTAWPAGVAAILLVMAGVAAWRVGPRPA